LNRLNSKTKILNGGNKSRHAKHHEQQEKKIGRSTYLLKNLSFDTKWWNSSFNCILQCVSSWRIVVVEVIRDRCSRRIVVCSGLKCLRWNMEWKTC